MDTLFLIENIKTYCKVKSVAPTKACIESGAGKDFIANLKKGGVPSVEKVQLLAEYLGITSSQLLGEKEPPVSEDSERLKELYGADDEKIKLALDLMDQLTPENRQRAEDYLQYLLDKQADTGGK